MPASRPPVRLAAVGTRALTPDEDALCRATASALVRRGAIFRSGGARGADTAWAFGAAEVDPARVEVSLARAADATPDRVPEGAAVRVPPYTPAIVQMARAEWEMSSVRPAPDPALVIARVRWALAHTLPHLGLGEPSAVGDLGMPQARLIERLDKAKGWAWIESDNPYVRDLMIRNADIVVGDPAPTALVACFSPEVRQGGGTGHGWRLAQALGLPVFNLRDPVSRESLRAWCDVHLPSRRPSVRR